MFEGLISEAFIPYLPLYAEAEAAGLNQLVVAITDSEAGLASTDQVPHQLVVCSFAE